MLRNMLRLRTGANPARLRVSGRLGPITRAVYGEICRVTGCAPRRRGVEDVPNVQTAFHGKDASVPRRDPRTDVLRERR